MADETSTGATGTGEQTATTETTTTAATETQQTAQTATTATETTAKTETTKTADVPAWGDDWRERMAAGNEDLLKTLKRYTSPENYAKAGYQAQQKIRSGEYKRGLPAEAGPEEIATWRKENGIPEKPEDYKIEPPKGVVFGETDKPLLDSFAQHAHANNWDQKTLNDAVAWYGQFQERQIAEQAAKDDQFQAEAHDALRDMWPGADYHRNVNAAKGLISSLPKEFQGLFAHARTADGRVLGDHPVILSTLAQLAREMNPAATVVPAGTQDAPKAIETELSQLRTMMRDPASAYHKGPDATKNQQRYRELLNVQEKLKGRAA